MLASKKKSASISKKGKTPTAADIKSFVRNILLASPDFPGFYARLLISEGYNPNQAKALAVQYQKKFGANMPVHANVKTCTHIKVTGVRCGSPALRGEEFCYFHQRMLRTVKSPKMRLHHVALLENEEAIQASIMEVINALVRGTIELKRGELILRALNAAVRNSRRARFDIHSSDMVKQLPDFNDEPEPIPTSAAAQYTENLRKQPASEYRSPNAPEETAPKEQETTAHSLP